MESRRDVVTSDRILGLRVEEIAKLGLSFSVASGDPHDVASIFDHQISIFVDEGLPHRAACSSSTQKTIVFWNGRHFP